MSGLDEILLHRWGEKPLINIYSTNNPDFPNLAKPDYVTLSERKRPHWPRLKPSFYFQGPVKSSQWHRPQTGTPSLSHHSIFTRRVVDCDRKHWHPQHPRHLQPTPHPRADLAGEEVPESWPGRAAA